MFFIVNGGVLYVAQDQSQHESCLEVTSRLDIQRKNYGSQYAWQNANMKPTIIRYYLSYDAY